MNKRLPIIIGIIITCLAAWLQLSPTKNARYFLERLENLGYDLQLKARVLTEFVKPQTPIAIVDIDDKSLKNEGRWPWPRSKLAKLVDQLQQKGAAVIAFDIFFAEPETNPGEQILGTLSDQALLSANEIAQLKQNNLFANQDALFSESLKQATSLLAIGFLPRDQKQNVLPPPILMLNAKEQQYLDIYKANGYISNIPILQNATKGGGFINIFPDSDGIIRRAALLMNYQGAVYPALSLQAVRTFLDEKISLVTPAYNDEIELEAIRLGPSVIPTDSRGQVLIPFVGRSYTFATYSATDVLNGTIPSENIAGKIIFIGTSATGSGDLMPTAVQNPFPGVEIQATLAHGILLNKFSFKPAWTFGANLFFTLFFGLLAAVIFPYLGPRLLSLIIIFVPIILLFINNRIWHDTGLILSMLMPALLILLISIFNLIYGYLFETRKREKLKEMFGQYVPSKHIDEMLKTTNNYALRGEDRSMSVLFADIRNFTHISEDLSAKELVQMLNTFFTPMTEIIFKHRGTIDKYVGDLIMAFWGAPLKDKYHARHAIESALEMQAKVSTMQNLLAENKWPELKIGIGINSGMMSVGDMGSRFRRNYTVLGDAVNLASRIEALTKYYGVGIIVTQETQFDQPRFVFRQLDIVKVKGKDKKIKVYEVVCAQTELTPELNEELTLYHQALDYYYAKEWDAAKVILEKLHTQYPNKKIYDIYLSRLNVFKTTGAPEDWDGSYIHLNK